MAGVSEPVRVEVDGEVFEVSEGAPGHYEFTWVSGPDPGYGFSSVTSDGSARTRAGLEESIRGFLAQVDPVTGFIE